MQQDNLLDIAACDILDLSPNIIFIKDLNNKVVWANQTMANVYEITKEQLYEMFNTQSLTNEIALQYIKDDLEVFSTGKPKYNIIERYATHLNKVLWAQTNKIPIKNTEGKIIGLVGFSTDITTIRERNLEFETLISSIPEIIMVFDYDGTCLKIYQGKVNTWMHQIDIVGQKIDIMKSYPNIVKQFYININELKKDDSIVRQFEFSNIIDGAEYYFEALMSSYNGTKVMVIIRDITDRKKLDVLDNFNKSIKELMSYNQKVLKTLGHIEEINNG